MERQSGESEKTPFRLAATKIRATTAAPRWSINMEIIAISFKVLPLMPNFLEADMVSFMVSSDLSVSIVCIQTQMDAIVNVLKLCNDKCN